MLVNKIKHRSTLFMQKDKIYLTIINFCLTTDKIGGVQTADCTKAHSAALGQHK